MKERRAHDAEERRRAFEHAAIESACGGAIDCKEIEDQARAKARLGPAALLSLEIERRRMGGSVQ